MWAFELLLLVVLVAVVVLAIRGGKPAARNPLVIHRSGQFHITLAPQLKNVQAFIECIVKRCAQSGMPAGDVPTQFFEVCDPAMAGQRESGYLLAASWRGGTWYFQAINRSPLLSDKDSHLNNLRVFSAAVLSQLPLAEPVDAQYAQNLRHAIENAALPFKIDVHVLQ